MESHTAVADTPAPENPEAAPESSFDSMPDLGHQEEAPSFTEALEAALNDLGNTSTQPTEPESEAVEESPQVEEEVQSEEVQAQSNEPVENLNEDVGNEWTPKAANRFKQLKDELKSNQSEAEKLRQLVSEQDLKIKEMSGLVENRDIDQLQDRIATYEQEKIINDLESTDAYNEAVTEPLQQIVGEADSLAEKYDVDIDSLIDALSFDEADAQDEALMELLPNASDRDKAKIYNIIDKIDPILDRRNHLMSNAEEALQEARAIEEQNYNQELAEESRIRNVVTKNVANRVLEKLPFLSGIEGFDMSSLQDTVAEVSPDTIHPVDFAYNGLSAKLVPIIVREYIQLRKEAEALTDQLSTYENAEPTMSGSPQTDSVTPRRSGMSFTDSIEAALSGG